MMLLDLRPICRTMREQKVTDYLSERGAVAQLIERYIRIVEVEGLSPFGSTNEYDTKPTFRLSEEQK